jgi:16S rRNA (cytosine967-C5)-methyltransferase
MLIEQRLAVEAIHGVLCGRSLTALLERSFGQHPELDAGQRGAIFDIAHGSLRHLGLLRQVCALMLRKPLNPPQLEALLVAALYQLAFTRAAPYAVVDHAVRAAEQAGWIWAKGMVNALLRRFLREREALLERARETPQGRYSYPLWWVERIRAAYPDRWEAILDAGNRQAATSLRVNARRGTRDEYLNALHQAGIDATAFDDVGVMLARPMPVAQIPGFARGLVSVQDVGAQLAARFLDLQPGQRVLDAFAAPGGKAAHILERETVHLVALDNDPERLRRVHDNLHRLGLEAASACADAAEPDRWWDGEAFDRVLADLPCTASGVVRRHPDIKWLRRESDIAALAARAARLLDCLWRVVRPGGKLLIATCSVFREENRGQVDDFVGRHADARLAPLPGQDSLDVQLLPDERHDGFYYALLERAQPSPG